MVSTVARGVLDAKIINDKGKDSAVRVVAEEARGGGFSVAVHGEMLD